MNANTQVTITSALPDVEMRLRSLRMNDALSRPFEIELELLVDGVDLDEDALLGTPMGAHFERPDGQKRHFHGLVSQIELAGSTGRFAVYQMSLRPGLWLLRQSVNCRIFQAKSVPEIVKTEVLKAQGFDQIDDQLTGAYAARDYCVQYGESDFDFISRLMEEEGIYYYFRHEKDKHVLVLCDSARAHHAPPQGEDYEYRPQSRAGVDAQEGFSEWRGSRAVVPGAAVFGDYDFEKPRTELLGKSLSPAGRTQGRFEQFEFPGGFKENAAGEGRAKIRREALQAAQRGFRGVGNAFGLGVGNLFSLTRHPRESLNQKYLVTGATHEVISDEFEHGSQPDAASFRLASSYTAVTGAQGFRPPRLTGRPVMRGPQTAVVTGPSGKEIHTDQYGRVRLKFFWDREGKSDDTSSCWVRVSQGSAGKQWGQMAMPRVGEEVIVDFLDGDPDRPIVTGRVYNADRMPPYALPDQQTRSTMKSRSTPDGGDDNFNELRFEDKRGAEEIYLHAERDFNRVVENNDTLKVGFDKKDEGNQTIEIFNNQTVAVGCSDAADGSQQMTVWKDRKATIRTGDESLTVEKGSRTVSIAKDDGLTVKGGDCKVKIESGSHTIEAAVAITLKVGSNSITIDQNGISLKGLQITIEGDTGVKVKALQVQIDATASLNLSALCAKVDSKALLTMKGALVQIN